MKVGKGIKILLILISVSLLFIMNKEKQFNMSNIITLHRDHQNIDEWLCMSNGTTSVFISLLALSGSRLAQSDLEKELIIWLAERVVGFMISDIPWTKQGFQSEREFLLKVTEQAKLKPGWDVLNYEPNEAIIIPVLDKFAALLSNFSEEYLDEAACVKWNDMRNDPKYGIPVGFPKCPKHGVLLHWNGCAVCNDL